MQPDVNVHFTKVKNRDKGGWKENDNKMFVESGNKTYLAMYNFGNKESKKAG